MSYNHPNQLTKPKGRNIALHRVLNFWPLLIWFGAIFVAFWAYKQGVVFRRLNGAVDVYQESVSPFEEGNFDRLAPGIERGKTVTKGDVVAYMRDDVLVEKIDILKHEIETRRTERLRHYDEDLLKLDSEIRKINADLKTSKAEQDACQEEITRIEKRFDAFPGLKPADRDSAVNDLAAAFRIKLAKSKALADASKIDMGEVENQRTALKRERDALANESDVKKYAERNQAAQLAQLEHRVERLTLKATHDGIVDLVLKEEGEFVKQGEGILKIVGEANQIVGFLAQDQLKNIAVGQKIWITSTKDRANVIESKVNFMAPRMNSLKDVSGGSTNRLFGRDIICEYPRNSGLLPGQTVIIWLEEPGKVPWLNRLLTNEDAEGGK